MSAHRGMPEMRETPAELQDPASHARNRSYALTGSQSTGSPLCGRIDRLSRCTKQCTPLPGLVRRPNQMATESVPLAILAHTKMISKQERCINERIESCSCLSTQCSCDSANLDHHEQQVRELGANPMPVSVSTDEQHCTLLLRPRDETQFKAVETVQTVITCEGDLHSPHFKRKFAALKIRLTRLLKTSRRSLNVSKMEPWNSVKVTMQLSRRLADKLKKLAEHDADLLRSLGILGVQVQGDRHINLQLTSATTQPQPSSSSGSTSQNSIVNIINQLVSSSDDQLATPDGASSSDCQVAASTSVTHLATCASASVRLPRPDADADAEPETEEEDQVVCTCGASSLSTASPTPASSSNSAVSGNGFIVPADTEQQVLHRRLTADATLDSSDNDQMDECTAMSNGSSSFAPFSSNQSPHHYNGPLGQPSGDSHSESTTANSLGSQPLVAMSSSRSTPTTNIALRSQSLSGVPASLSNFVAVDLAATASPSFCFTLNDDNILDDSTLTRSTSLDHSALDPLAPNGTSSESVADMFAHETALRVSVATIVNPVLGNLLRDGAKRAADQSECNVPTSTSTPTPACEAFARPQRPLTASVTQSVALPPARTAMTNSNRLPQATVLDKSDRVQVVKMPLVTGTLTDDDEAETKLLRTNPASNATLAPQSQSSNSQVRIIQIPSKSPATNRLVTVGVASNKASSRANTLPSAQPLSSLAQHTSLNGVLNGACEFECETNLNCSVGNKRIRIDTNSHRSSDSDDDAFK